jgi:hypothetical protein
MIRRKRQLSERDLTSLADGSIPASRTPRVEREIAASRELQADLAAQRHALAALAEVAEERAPSALRARLELARDPRPRKSRPRRGWAAIPAAAAATAVILLAVGGGPSGAPTVAAAATLASRAPIHPAGMEYEHTQTLRWPTAGGLSFPDWARRFGFVAVGMRSDRLNGRDATTVFYQRGEDRIAYTIVSGRALAVGTATGVSTWQRTRLWTLSVDRRAVVTWLRDGHSCVLSGKPSLLAQLERLAAWEPSHYAG